MENLDEVDKKLDNISSARAEFRTSVREYQQDFRITTSRSQHLDETVSSMNQLVKKHQHSLWDRIEQIRWPLQYGPPVNPMSGPLDNPFMDKVLEESRELMYFQDKTAPPDDPMLKPQYSPWLQRLLEPQDGPLIGPQYSPFLKALLGLPDDPINETDKTIAEEKELKDDVMEESRELFQCEDKENQKLHLDSLEE